jgi:hypothetical protein
MIDDLRALSLFVLIDEANVRRLWPAILVLSLKSTFFTSTSGCDSKALRSTVNRHMSVEANSMSTLMRSLVQLNGLRSLEIMENADL